VDLVGIDIDASGNIFVADAGNNEIRKITLAGVVRTFAGPFLGFAENGSMFESQFNSPTDVVVDASENIYVADWGNNKIRKITQVLLSGNPAGHVGVHHVLLNANDGNGGSTDQSFTITVNATLGIDKNIIKGFTLYPNPVKNILNIQVQENINNVKLFNLLGQQIVQKNVNDNKILLDISSLIQGTYIAIVTTDKTIKSVKFIKE